jgi:NAD+-dependent protein deacetylase sirtuin 4
MTSLRLRMPEGPPPSSGRPPGPASEEEVRALARFLRNGPVVVLAGAGCSTESGIPDYRGPSSRGRDRRPVLYQEFVRDPEARSRYWARSAVGWPRFTLARANDAHRALAELEAGGVVAGVISQNVDGLHQVAGSRSVLELHGSLDRVRCLECGAIVSRLEVQRRLEELNPSFGWADGEGGDAPRSLADGDAALDPSAHRGFRVPGCTECGGVLKPDVVFFGENVPRERVERAWELFGRGRSLLVVGSSLTVYSGRRFVDRARLDGRPVAIVNVGPTRGDGPDILKVEDRVGRVLPRVAALVAS